MCVYTPPSQEELSERDKMGKRGKTNKRNNKELSAFLLSQGYGIKNVQGSYIENLLSSAFLQRPSLPSALHKLVSSPSRNLYTPVFSKNLAPSPYLPTRGHLLKSERSLNRAVVLSLLQCLSPSLRAWKVTSS